MDLGLEATQAAVQRTARELASTLAREAPALDTSGAFPANTFRRLAELGLLAVNVPRNVGGSEAGAVAFTLAVEEIARSCASTAVMMSVTNMVGETIARFGSPAQRQAHCPRLARGDYGVGSFALSEPDAGSDPGAMRTRAERVPGGWVLNGRKQWITGAAHAGVILVWARTDRPQTLTKGLSCFLVERGTPGLSVGAPENKMGIRASNTVSLELADCHVPRDALLGDENGGFKIAMAALDGGRLGIAAQAVGIGGAALDATLRWVGRREAPPGDALGERATADAKLADMRVSLDAARLLTWRAAWLKETRRPFTREAAMAKVYASEAAVAVCNDAVRMHGTDGCLPEFAVERHLRDARVTMIYEGTSEIQRLVIARSALESP